MSDAPIPPLRFLDVFPIRHNGESLVALRDPEGICEETFVMRLPGYLIANCFDGRRSAGEARAAFRLQYGLDIQTADVAALAGQLDERFLLRSPRYLEKRREVEREFDALRVRPAAHAGQAYPAEAAAFRQTVESFFTLPGGAGPIDGHGATERRRLAGLVIPHMDPRCSGACSSWALKALAESERPDAFVIFGVSHHPARCLFSACDKDFETPLGAAPCDRELLGALRRGYGAQRLDDAMAHRTEHSAEFMAVLIHAMYGDSMPPIVPILCGSFHEFIESGKSPLERPEVAEFRQCMRDAVRQSGKRVCYVSGADLAHMGRKFGDEFGVSEALIESTRARDGELLDFAARLDAEGFFQHVAREKDARKICGLPPTYMALVCMDAARSQLLKHDWNVESETDSLVSFCSMAFYIEQD